MKVCTDTCLFGAWVAHFVENHFIERPQYIIDIGSGTGVLSLLLAQKINALIDAVEKDKKSYDETMLNFINSPWTQRLQAFHEDINIWQPSRNYDLIVCNPPFYENDLLPANEEKAISKHHLTFSLEQLLSVSNTLISANGLLAVLLPFKRLEEFIKKAKKYSWNVIMQTDVKQTTKHSPFRAMLFLQKENKTIMKNELSIKDNCNAYTQDFVHLLKDYYLYL